MDVLLGMLIYICAFTSIVFFIIVIVFTLLSLILYAIFKEKFLNRLKKIDFLKIFPYISAFCIIMGILILLYFFLK